MSCIVRPGTVMKYTGFYGEVHYYVLDDVATDDKVWSKCVSSTGDLLDKAGYFVVDTRLDDYYEHISGELIKDWCPKEGNLCLYKSRDTEGEWKVLKYTKFSVGYCFDSLTDNGKYNLPGGIFVYPLTGITESMVTEGSGSKGGYDDLAEEYHNLLEEYDKLSDDYEELYDSHDELVSDYQVLGEQKDELEKEVDFLKKENEKLRTMNEVKTEAIENYIHPDSCKYWDGESCTCVTKDVKPYKEEVERLKNLVIKLTEELMERR